MASVNPTFITMETKKVDAVSTQASVTEDMEQRRRLLDIKGEQQRKLNASKVSQSIKASEPSLKHVPQPVSAPLFTRQERSLLQEGKLAVNSAIQSIENTTAKVASTLSSAASGVGQSAAAFGHKTADLASSFSHAARDTFDTTLNKASVLATDISIAATNAKHKTQDFGYDVRDFATIAAHKTQDFGCDVRDFATETYAEYKPRVVDTAHLLQKKAVEAKGIALEAKDKLVNLADDITFSTTKAYAVALMEAERRRRMIDVDEQYAIINARNMSNVIKGLGFEYYRQFGQTFSYTDSLLVEKERTWRMLSLNAALAKSNANKVAVLITRRFATVTGPTPASLTQEIKIQEVITPTRRAAVGTPAL